MQVRDKCGSEDAVNRDLDGVEKCEHDRQPRGPSQLFLLRVWRSDTPGQNDWQGKLQRAVTGETHYFKSWEDLRRILSGITSPPRAGLPEGEPLPDDRAGRRNLSYSVPYVKP